MGYTSKNNLLSSPRWVAEDLFSLVLLCWTTLQPCYAISWQGSRCLMVFFQSTLRPPQLSWLRRCISSCCCTLPILGKDCPCVHPLCPALHQGMITESCRILSWKGPTRITEVRLTRWQLPLKCWCMVRISLFAVALAGLYQSILKPFSNMLRTAMPLVSTHSNAEAWHIVPSGKSGYSGCLCEEQLKSWKERLHKSIPHEGSLMLRERRNKTRSLAAKATCLHWNRLENSQNYPRVTF